MLSPFNAILALTAASLFTLCSASSLLLADPHHLPPLDPAETLLPIDAQQVERVAALSVEQYTDADAWPHVAHTVRATGTLRIVVMGMSTTSGCGAHDPLKTCDPDASWARRMHDLLASALHALPSAPRLNSRISFKNAVSPLFYESCIAEYAPADTDVVLLEVVQSILFDIRLSSPWDGVRALLRALRRAVPRAAVALVALPQPHQIDQTDFWESLRRLAVEEACDVIQTVPAMQHPLPTLALEHGGVNAWRPSRFALGPQAIDMWYAHKDPGSSRPDHHPSGAGHQLLGHLTASYVLRRLQNATASRRAARDGVATPEMRGGRLREVCFHDGELPVGKGSIGFELRDEGTPGQGVKKMGLVSRHIGDVLRIGPVRARDLGGVERQRECTLVTSRLGYFTTSHPGQGALLLSCQGCTCLAFNDSTRFTPGFLPFPLVRTDNLLHVQAMPGGKNYSGTATTVFHMVMRRDEPCYVVARHVRGRKEHHEAPQRPSHVRVDSFAVSVDSMIKGVAIDSCGIGVD